MRYLLMVARVSLSRQHSTGQRPPLLCARRRGILKLKLSPSVADKQAERPYAASHEVCGEGQPALSTGWPVVSSFTSAGAAPAAGAVVAPLPPVGVPH